MRNHSKRIKNIPKRVFVPLEASLFSQPSIQKFGLPGMVPESDLPVADCIGRKSVRREDPLNGRCGASLPPRRSTPAARSAPETGRSNRPVVLSDDACRTGAFLRMTRIREMTNPRFQFPFRFTCYLCPGIRSLHVFCPPRSGTPADKQNKTAYES